MDLESLLADAPNREFISDLYAEHEKSIGKSKYSKEVTWGEFLRDLRVISELEVTEFIKLLNDEEWVAQREHAWFCKVFAFLNDNRRAIEKQELSDKLKSLSIIPTTQVGLQAVLGQKLYLPIENEVEISYCLFADHVKLVDQALFNMARGVSDSEKIVSFLQWLGIQPFEPYHAIRDVIIPIFESDQWNEIETEMHFDYLDFVRRHWWTYREQARQIDGEENAVERVQQVLRFQCHSTSDQYNLVSELLLAQVYGPDDDLESMLRTVPGLDFISEHYFEQEKQSREIKAFTGPSWGDFLRDLGVVYRFELTRIIDGFVLPQFQSESWKEDERWFALTDFIRCNLPVYEENNPGLDKLKDCLWIASTHVEDGVKYFNRPSALYMSPVYEENADVAVAFGDLLANCYISDDYLEKSARGKKKEDRRELRKSWKEFFNKIGVLDYIPLQESDWNSLFTDFFEELPTVQDIDYRQKRACAFLKMLDKYWSKVYQQAAENNSSLLAYRFKQYAWIPTKGNALVSPDTKIFDPKLEKLVGDPNRICAERFVHTSLQKFLGIQTELLLDDALELLTEIRCQYETVDLEQIRGLYEWLQKYLLQNESSADKQRIRQEFEKYELIYLTAPLHSSLWSKADLCCWEPASYKFIDNYRPVLSRIYDGLRQFFVDDLNVRIRADESDCLGVLANEITIVNKLEEETFGEVFRLYLEIEKKLEIGDTGVASTITLYQDAPIWLCEDGILRSKPEMYINDHQQLYQLFKEEISCVWFAVGYPVSAWTNLIREFGLNRLSEVQSEITGYLTSPNDEVFEDWMDGLLRLIHSLVQYLFTHDYSKCRQMWDVGIINQLYSLNPVAVLDSIPVQYRLPHGEIASDNQKVYADLREGNLYVAPGLKLRDLSLSKEICRALGADREIQNFVNSILPYLDDEDAFNEFIQQQDLLSLSQVETGIQGWKVELERKVQDNEIVPSVSGTLDVISTEEEYGTPEVTFEQETEDDDTTLPLKPSPEAPLNGSGSPAEVARKEKDSTEYQRGLREQSPHRGPKNRDSQPEIRTGVQPPKGRKQKQDDNEKQTLGEQSRRAALLSSGPRLTGPSTSPGRDNILEPSGQKDWQPECSPWEAKIRFKRFEGGHEKFNKQTAPAERRLDPLSPPAFRWPGNRKPDTDNLSPQAKKAIGRWGEEFALKQLLQKYSVQAFVEETNSGFVVKTKGEVTTEINWVNKNGESGASYDIEVISNGVRTFYEVKSTKTASKEWFDISTGEWDLAQIADNNFCILRVHNAGSKKHATIMEVWNPYKLWKEGKLAAKVVRIEL